MEHEVQTRHQYWGKFEPKKAEASNTHTMPPTFEPKRGPDKDSKTVIPKTAGVNPRVDVSRLEPPVQHMKKTAAHYALPSHQRYPLDSYADVEQAVGYFQKWGSQFTPALRREYCTNLVKRAHVLGIPTDSRIEKYGSVTYAPMPEVNIALDGRRALLQDEELHGLLDKMAEQLPTIAPDLFAASLAEFDKLAHLDHLYDEHLPDPFYSVFGVKTAQESDGSYVMGNDIVTDNQLRDLAKTDCMGIKEKFGEEVAKEFKKDPVGIFKSLPLDQKKIISRMANEAKVE